MSADSSGRSSTTAGSSGKSAAWLYGKGAKEQERMDYLEFIARVTSPLPDKGQVTVHYYGLYANAHRGKKVMTIHFQKSHKRSNKTNLFIHTNSAWS